MNRKNLLRPAGRFGKQPPDSSISGIVDQMTDQRAKWDRYIKAAALAAAEIGSARRAASSSYLATWISDTEVRRAGQPRQEGEPNRGANPRLNRLELAFLQTLDIRTFATSVMNVSEAQF